MKIHWAHDQKARGEPAYVEQSQGWFTAVTAEGQLVLSAPLSKSRGVTQLSKLGYCPTSGKLPKFKSALAHGTAFQIKVWQGCRKIPRGQTLTYGQLAKQIGCRSAQAIGHALGANPLAQIIPCHRIVNAQGLGGFAWGQTRKRSWLQAEDALLD
jgi:O-6-methylguanine DNA methyltransferase